MNRGLVQVVLGPVLLATCAAVMAEQSHQWGNCHRHLSETYL
jgi:hypothetical protein